MITLGTSPLAISEELAKSLNVLTLQELESEMINQSLDIKIKGHEVDAAKEKREALPSIYIPKLTLDGSFKYLSEIPEINMAPGRTLKFGDNKNYSIGPTLSMTIFDFNSKANLQTSLDKNLSSKENEAKSLKANILFKVRYHYLNLVFLLEKRNLISESLKVANKQLKDVLSKNRFGSGSKLDLLTAQKEVHELESQLKEINFNVTAEQTELYKITFHQKIKDANLIDNTNRLENLIDLQNRFLNYQNFTQDVGSQSHLKVRHNQFLNRDIQKSIFLLGLLLIIRMGLI
jgi:outer membrane protein TolC